MARVAPEKFIVHRTCHLFNSGMLGITCVKFVLNAKKQSYLKTLERIELGVMVYILIVNNAQEVIVRTDTTLIKNLI